MRKGLQKGSSIVLIAILTILIIICDYFGYIPVKYDYEVGSVATSDIYASRNVVDNYQTKHDAVIAKNSVPTIFVRSEDISMNNLVSVKSFFQLIRQARSSMISEMGTVVSDTTEIRETLIANISSALGFELDDSDAQEYLTMSYLAFDYLEDKSNSISEVLMMDSCGVDVKTALITNQVNYIFEKETNFSSYSSLLIRTLDGLLVPNTEYDLLLTEEAAQNEYNYVMSNPVEVEKGAKIISVGQVITEHEYQLLDDLELLRDNQFSLLILSRVIAYVLTITAILIFYVYFNKEDFTKNTRLLISLIVSFIIPIFVAIYTSDLSKEAVAILFFTAICSTYLGYTNGIILSVFQLVYMLPIYSFDGEVIFTSIIGIMICAMITGRKSVRNSSAGLIIYTTISVAIASVVFNFLNGSVQQRYVDSLIWSSISTLISVVAAVGLMPIFELASNAVSPIKLIYLSQQSQYLLNQLFMTAPGTHQHSIMVANLSEAAADAVGADALLCRVGAYYHDIGKLEKPEFFTENQDGVNPHDNISPEESIDIITSHTSDGVLLAKKHHLPTPVVNIISEHHGNMYPAFFYNKIVERCKNNGEVPPPAGQFTYKNNIPQTKESAIVMLADTCEAAIKSMKLTNASDVEPVIRNLFKSKIDNDQLRDSHLSFEDLEKITSAFVRVYSGIFSQRISYKNEDKLKERKNITNENKPN